MNPKSKQHRDRHGEIETQREGQREREGKKETKRRGRQRHWERTRLDDNGQTLQSHV